MLDLPQKLELAAKTLIENVGELPCYAGLSTETQSMPRAVVSALTGSEMPQGSGNFMMTLRIQVLSKADDSTIEEHRTRCQNNIGVFMNDDIASQLSGAIPDFSALGFTNRAASESVEDRDFVTELSMDVYCAGLALV